MAASSHSQSKSEKKQGVSGTQSVDRTLHLLELVAQYGPISLQALCKRAELNRTTAWRLLAALEEHHFVERIPATKEYDLGFAASLLCTTPQRRYTPLIRCAQPYMEALMEESQETIMLSVCHFDSTSVIYQIDPPSSVHLKDYVNQPTPLWGTSNGKVALAYFSPEEQARFLTHPLTAFTNDTVVDPDQLKEELTRVYEDGYAIVEGEWSLEENAIAAPILANGKLVASLGIGGPRFRFTREQMLAIAPFLCKAAASIGACVLGKDTDDE